MERFCIVGAGFSGAVLARELAGAGYKVLIVETRNHVAGNCFTQRDAETGVMVHTYGPHIFHTAYDHVWDYIQRFCEMMPYVNRVKTNIKGRIYSLPINLHTINQFFDKAYSPAEARAFISSEARTDIEEPQNFEEQALKLIGDRLYRAFFYGYTLKQWGVEPRFLPASVLRRLPIRFNYDDNYFSHPYQGIPRFGYTRIVENILDHENIELRIGCSFETLSESFSHTFYTGPIDRYFDFKLGELGYRTLDFDVIRSDMQDYQGLAVMNYGDLDVPYTRITEHKHFSPQTIGETHGSVLFRESSRACTRLDVPYYPIRLTTERAMLQKYVDLVRQTTGVTFMGRLGTYQYLDMDETIHRSLQTAKIVLQLKKEGGAIPSFAHNPL